MLDLPGIIEGAKDGKGRGRQVIAVARTCSLIFIVLDVLKPLQHKKLLEHELEGFGLRLNKQPPNIAYRKKDKGGINLNTTVCIKFGLISNTYNISSSFSDFNPLSASKYIEIKPCTLQLFCGFINRVLYYKFINRID